MKKMLIADDNKQITTILSGYAKRKALSRLLRWTEQRHWINICSMSMKLLSCCWML